MRRKEVKRASARVAEGTAADGSGMRERILTSTLQVLRAEGVVGLTTRAIALRAGIAEGTIYRYFADKIDLVQTAIREQILPPVIAVEEALPRKVGTGSVEQHLSEVVETTYAFYRQVIPLMSALLSDHQLVSRFRRSFEEHGRGPRRLLEPVAEYLRAEQRLGRVRQSVDPNAAASMLLGGCFLEVFLENLHGRETLPLTGSELVARMIATLFA